MWCFTNFTNCNFTNYLLPGFPFLSCQAFISVLSYDQFSKFLLEQFIIHAMVGRLVSLIANYDLGEKVEQQWQRSVQVQEGGPVM